MILKRLLLFILFLNIGLFIWMDLEQRKFEVNYTQETASMPQVGFQAPNFSLIELGREEESETTDSTDSAVYVDLPTILSEKEGAVIYFWTSWCPFCEASVRALEEGHLIYGDELAFVGINVTSQDSLRAAQTFVKEHNVSFQMIADETGIVASTYHVPPVPATFFINQDGVIAHRKVGGLTTREVELGISVLKRSGE
ncbi:MULTISPECIES: TlpA family protein disulfide reductase [Bacillaceae]|uniref:TlpA family protein disulfide reductase n=1 Tax=Evansella alkalicola TaxID=745819 RepID=A0ABS6JW71_9BACI|nr:MULTISPECIES: TlpA disulfide reductase family protein [Bacillaceae]MBU9722635.1 TlpA family protein disulfide reductase [Bacillus alkalicola]